MSTKKLQVIDYTVKQAENADTVDGKHASEFGSASDVSDLQSKVGDTAVADQISTAITPVSESLDNKLDKSGGTITGNLEFSTNKNIYFNKGGIKFGNGGEGGVFVYDTSLDDTNPKLSFYGAYGDEHVTLNNIEIPTNDYDAANKQYVDTKPGRIVAGETFEYPSGTTVTASTGAEIFNDLSTREYNELDNTTIDSGNIATGTYSHAEGYCTTATGNNSHAEGYSTIASGTHSHAEGYGTTASGTYSHAEGGNTTATTQYSHAEGYKTTTSGNYSHAEGRETTASGQCSHAEGKGTTASNNSSHAEGYYTTASEGYSHSSGYYTTAKRFQTAIGRYNQSVDGPSTTSSTTGSLFIIGKGTSSSALSNAFRVATTGAVYGAGAYNSSGADYAEYFEWQDGNSNNEDRRGLFVTLDGDKIRLANADDIYILGIVSAFPAIIGDANDDQWHGMYLTDVYGAPVIQEVVNEDGTIEQQLVLNPEYNSEEQYIPRSERKEWAVVGMLGKIVVVDDGTCQVNSYCKVSNNGIGTTSDTGYRVIARIDETHVKVLFR